MSKGRREYKSERRAEYRRDPSGKYRREGRAECRRDARAEYMAGESTGAREGEEHRSEGRGGAQERG